MHKKVQVVVINPHGQSAKLLLLQTGVDRGEYWQPVTGSVDKNEKFKAAAFRELVEETGIDQGELVDLKYEQEFHDRWERNVKERSYLFLTANENPLVRIDSKEHQNFRWVELNQINQETFRFPGNYNAFKLAKGLLEQTA